MSPSLPLRLPEQFRPHLQGLRKARGLTQSELGQRLGLGQSRIAEIEADPGAVSLRQLMSVLAELGACLMLDDGLEPTSSPRTRDTATVRNNVRQAQSAAGAKHGAARVTTGRKAPASASSPPAGRLRFDSKKGSW